MKHVTVDAHGGHNRHPFGRLLGTKVCAPEGSYDRTEDAGGVQVKVVVKNQG